MAKQNTKIVIYLVIGILLMLSVVVHFSLSTDKSVAETPVKRVALQDPPGGYGMVYQCKDALESKFSATVCDDALKCERWFQNAWSAAECDKDRRATALAALKQKQEDEELAKKEAKLEECRKDLKCWGDRVAISSLTACQLRIEAFAKYQFKWDNSWIEPKMRPQMWADKQGGKIIFAGSSILMQNGFGAWQRQHYFCTIDIQSDAISGVEVR